jgi:hypothetical protein
MGYWTIFVVADDQEIYESFQTMCRAEPRTVVEEDDSPASDPITGEATSDTPRMTRMVERTEWVPVGRPFVEVCEQPRAPLWKRLLGLVPVPHDRCLPLPEWEVKKFLDQLSLEELHCILKDVPCTSDLSATTTALVPPPNMPERCDTVERLVPDFVSRLASLEDARLTEVADSFRDAIKDDPNLGPPAPEDVRDGLEQLRALAKLAVEQQKGLFVTWEI